MIILRQRAFSGRKALIQEYVRTGDKILHNEGGRLAKTAKGELIPNPLYKVDYLQDITAEQKRNIEANIRRRAANGIKTDTTKIEKALDNRANAIDRMMKGKPNKQLIRYSL
jgi:hypothetical protein